MIDAAYKTLGKKKTGEAPKEIKENVMNQLLMIHEKTKKWPILFETPREETTSIQ